MAWRAPGSLSSPLLSEELFRRAVTFLFGDFTPLRLAPDPRLEDPRLGAGGLVIDPAVKVELVGDLEVDAIGVGDVVGLDCFGVVVVLAAGCGPVPEFAMEADLEFMNPASVG